MIHETQKDRDREMVVGEKLRVEMGYARFCRSKHLEHYDLYFLDGEGNCKGFCEIKCRSSRKFGDKPFNYMDFSKWKWLMYYELYLSMPCWFIAVYEDGIYAVRVSGLPLHHTPIRQMGRVDRITDDVELAMKIDNVHFVRMCDSEGVFK